MKSLNYVLDDSTSKTRFRLRVGIYPEDEQIRPGFASTDLFRGVLPADQSVLSGQ